MACDPDEDEFEPDEFEDFDDNVDALAEDEDDDFDNEWDDGGID